jgi:hypothetical protein
MERVSVQAKVAELNEWVDGPFKAYLQTLLDKAQRRTRIRLKFWQGMGTTFLDFNGDNQYRRRGDERDLMDLLEKASDDEKREHPLWQDFPELLEFLCLVYELDEAFDNWIVGDMVPTVPPKGQKV